MPDRQPSRHTNAATCSHQNPQKVTSTQSNSALARGRTKDYPRLELTLGKHNKGVYTARGVENPSNTGLSVTDALRMWLQVDGDFGFRPADEKDVRAEIEGVSAAVSARFQCPGRSSCITYMLGKRNSACGGTSDECVQLAKCTNGTYFQDKLILTTVGRIAHCVLTVIEQSQDESRAFLQREDLSSEELKKYNKVLISRKLAFRNIR